MTEIVKEWIDKDDGAEKIEERGWPIGLYAESSCLPEVSGLQCSL